MHLQSQQLIFSVVVHSGGVRLGRFQILELSNKLRTRFAKSPGALLPARSQNPARTGILQNRKFVVLRRESHFLKPTRHRVHPSPMHRFNVPDLPIIGQSDPRHDFEIDQVGQLYIAAGVHMLGSLEPFAPRQLNLSCAR